MKLVANSTNLPQTLTGRNKETITIQAKATLSVEEHFTKKLPNGVMIISASVVPEPTTLVTTKLKKDNSAR
mgnify:CR=1 FL=1